MDADRSFAFDYDHSGKLDHIVLYHPGVGSIYILKNKNGTFDPVYLQGDPGVGIGGYSLNSSTDRIFAFDYDQSGKMDHLVLYNPGGNDCAILKNEKGIFSPVYQGAGVGIATYNFASKADRAFAFDNDHSGKMDHIAVYRPGTGTFWIIANTNGNFSAVYSQGDPGSGIGQYNLLGPYDSALAFDYDHSGKMDHIILYRPGSGIIWIIKHDGQDFLSVYRSNSSFGIGGFDLLTTVDSVFAFDYESSGKQDYLAFYRPGTGIFEIMKHNGNDTFTPVYGGTVPAQGIGGYYLASSLDLAYAFDYRQTGRLDHIVLYRPSAGAIFIVEES